MEKGILQQYAAPADLKERPANLFVASFIGEPPMNIVDAVAVEEGGRRWLQVIDAGGKLAFRLALAGQASGRPAHGGLEPGVKYALGIRPHRLRIGAPGAAISGAEGLQGRVFSRQWLGDQTHLGVEIGGCPFVAVADGIVEAGIGSQLPVALPLGALHLFDRASGTALRHGLDAETKAA
jgi:multiple sugar transport system ATP-binding protein